MDGYQAAMLRRIPPNLRQGWGLSDPEALPRNMQQAMPYAVGFPGRQQPILEPWREEEKQPWWVSGLGRLLRPVEAFLGVPARAVGGALEGAADMMRGKAGMFEPIERAAESVAAPFAEAADTGVGKWLWQGPDPKSADRYRRIYPGEPIVDLLDMANIRLSDRELTKVLGVSITERGVAKFLGDVFVDPLMMVKAASQFRFARGLRQSQSGSPLARQVSGPTKWLYHGVGSKDAVPMTRRGERFFRESMDGLMKGGMNAEDAHYAVSRAITQRLEPMFIASTGDAEGAARMAMNRENFGNFWEMPGDASSMQLAVEGERALAAAAPKYKVNLDNHAEMMTAIFSPHRVQWRIPGLPDLKYTPIVPVPGGAELTRRITDLFRTDAKWQQAPELLATAYGEKLGRRYAPMLDFLSARWRGKESAFRRAWDDLTHRLRGTPERKPIRETMRQYRSSLERELEYGRQTLSEVQDSIKATFPVLRDQEEAYRDVIRLLETKAWKRGPHGMPKLDSPNPEELMSLASRAGDERASVVTTSAAKLRAVLDDVFEADSSFFRELSPKQYLEGYYPHVFRPEFLATSIPQRALMELSKSRPQLWDNVLTDRSIQRHTDFFLNPREWKGTVEEITIKKVLKDPRYGPAQLSELKDALARHGADPRDIEDMSVFIENPFTAIGKRLEAAATQRHKAMAVQQVLDTMAFDRFSWGRIADELKTPQSAAEAAEKAASAMVRMSRDLGYHDATAFVYFPVAGAADPWAVADEFLIPIANGVGRGKDEIAAEMSAKISGLHDSIAARFKYRPEGGGTVYILPKSVKEDMRKMVTLMEGAQGLKSKSMRAGGAWASPAFRTAIGGIHKVHALWKLIQTAWSPAYHVRNFADGLNLAMFSGATPGDIWNSMVTTLDWKVFRKIADVGAEVRPASIAEAVAGAGRPQVTRFTDALAARFRETYGMTPDAAVAEFGRQGLESSGWFRRELAGAGDLGSGGFMEAFKRSQPGAEMVMKIPEELAKQTLGVYSRAMVSVGGFVETSNRFAAFLSGLRRRMRPEDAADLARKYLYDYSERLPWEQVYGRAMIPFYNWTRANLERMTKSIWDRPYQFTMLPKTYAHAVEANEYDFESLPHFIKNRMGIPVARMGDGSVGYFAAQFWHSVGDLFSLGQDTVMSELAGMMTPVLRMPIEGLIQRSFHGMREIQTAPGEMGTVATPAGDIEVSAPMEWMLRSLRVVNDMDRITRIVEGRHPEQRAGGDPDALAAVHGFRIYTIDRTRRLRWMRTEMMEQYRGAVRAQGRAEANFGRYHPNTTRQQLTANSLRGQLSDIELELKRIQGVRPIPKMISDAENDALRLWDRYWDHPMVQERSNEDFEGVVEAFENLYRRSTGR